jgi:hypothetical protein
MEQEWGEDDPRKPDPVALKKVKRRVYDVLLVLESTGIVCKWRQRLQICDDLLGLIRRGSESEVVTLASPCVVNQPSDCPISP